MTNRSLNRGLALTALLSVAVASCGGPGAELPPDTSAAASTAAASPSGGASTDTPFAFTESDLDALERGLRKEIELVKAARARGDSAKTPEERGAAAQAAFETATAPAAAQAVGAPADRYQATRQTVNRVFQTLDFQGKIDGPMSLDTARASPEMKQRLASDPFAELAPASSAALRARMDRLVPIWIEYVQLTAVAG